MANETLLFLDAYRNNDEKFAFQGNYESITRSIPSLPITYDNIDDDCLVAKLKDGALEAMSMPCTNQALIVCRAWKKESLNCSTNAAATTTTTPAPSSNSEAAKEANFKTLDLLLNPVNLLTNFKAISEKNAYYKYTFGKVNLIQLVVVFSALSFLLPRST